MPTFAQMKMALKPNVQSVGANEAPGLGSKAFVSPDSEGVDIPIGGVDFDPRMPGPQYMTPPPQQPGQPQQPQAPQNNQAPGAYLNEPSSGQLPQGNMLNMTPQGQAMDAMSNGPQDQPQQLAKGGKVRAPYTHKLLNNTTGREVSKFTSEKAANDAKKRLPKGDYIVVAITEKPKKTIALYTNPDVKKYELSRKK